MTAHAPAHHATAAGGSFRLAEARREPWRRARRGRRRVIVPPAPRASAIVDPRIGDLGPALLALEDGTVFPGIAFGAPLAGGGDLVVNTSQTGYQEVCTDPSYAGQVVVMTYPLIGNYGRLIDDDQSAHPWLRALVVANATAAVLDDARQLAALLRGAGIPAIAGVDTRALARHLRANGCLRGIVTAPHEVDEEAARAAARAVPQWEDQDFVEGCRHRPSRTSATRPRGGPLHQSTSASKTNIVRSMRRRGARVRVFPYTASTSDVLSSDIDGVILSPGPGDPARLETQVTWPARSSTTAGRCWGSASATRSWAAPPAPIRGGCGSVTTAQITVQDMELGLVK